MKKQFISTNKKRMTTVDWDAIFKKTSHEFNLDEIEAAGNWEDCPVSCTSHLIRRNEKSEPLDSIMALLGCNILEEIKHQNFNEAKDLYTLIQHREGQLLTQMVKENKVRINEIDTERAKLILDNTEIENLLK